MLIEKTEQTFLNRWHKLGESDETQGPESPGKLKLAFSSQRHNN